MAWENALAFLTGGKTHQYADAPQTPLRERRERPRGSGTAKERDEFSPSHVINSVGDKPNQKY